MLVARRAPVMAWNWIYWAWWPSASARRVEVDWRVLWLVRRCGGGRGVFGSAASSHRACGIADGDGSRGQRFGNDRSGADDAAVANVSCNDSGVSDPRVTADVYPLQGAALLCDGFLRIAEAVLVASAQDINVGTYEDVVLDRGYADGASGADVDAAAEASLSVCERGEESNVAIRATALERPAVVRTAEKHPRSAGHKAQELGERQEPVLP